MPDEPASPHLGNSREVSDHDEYAPRPESVDEPRADVRIADTDQPQGS